MKLLAEEWARDGRVVWYGARESIRTLLTNALPDAIFCDTSEDLRQVIIGT